jgi:hypothetical protein
VASAVAEKGTLYMALCVVLAQLLHETCDGWPPAADTCTLTVVHGSGGLAQLYSTLLLLLLFQPSSCRSDVIWICLQDPHNCMFIAW